MRPSEQLLEHGAPNERERRAIEFLAERRDGLLEELEGPDYAGAEYDRQEASAISWALNIVRVLRERGGLDGRPD